MITAIKKYHQLSIAKELQKISWNEYFVQLFYSTMQGIQLEDPAFPCLESAA